MTRPGIFFSQQLSCFARGVTGCAVLLELYVFHINTVQLRPQKLRYHVAITYAIHCYCFSGLIFEKSTAQSLRQPKNRIKQWLVVHAMAFHESLEDSPCPKSNSFCVNVTIKVRVHLIVKDNFLQKIAFQFLVLQHPINKFHNSTINLLAPEFYI